jgi:hypothetical protein
VTSDGNGRNFRSNGLHIINLVAKAFLFGNDEESFKADEGMTKSRIQQLLAVRKE